MVSVTTVCRARSLSGESLAANGRPCDTDTCFDGTCDGTGTCQQGQTPRPAGSACPDTAPNDCLIAQCDGAGACNRSAAPKPANTACGDPSVSECDAADTCDAAGTCQPNHAAAGLVCTDTTPNNHFAPLCDGAGQCDQLAVVLPADAPTLARRGLVAAVGLLVFVALIALRRTRT